MLKSLIGQVVAGQDLSETEAEQAMDIIMTGEATPAQIAAFLTALRLKGETVEEITGFARSMRRRAAGITTRHQVFIDTCGTGGDGRHTFNISTTAAFVIAGAGVAVAKHGNRSVSSRCGSADVLEALGIKVDLPPAAVARCLDEVGMAFLFAPVFHGAMKYAAGPRREIGIRTVFNLLGPLTNPAGAPCQLVGVYDPSLTETVAAVLGRLGSRRAYVVHGSDGLDEVTTTGPTKITCLDHGSLTTYTFYPEDAGLPRAGLEDLAGGTAADNAAITRSVLKGEKGPARDVVLLNAAFGLLAAGVEKSLPGALATAATSIDSGAAMAKLQDMTAWIERWAA
ncbi:MAG: anthranilate phosphoribosyltransferase [Moorella sp. (in: firmicutes)]|uniref:anthranilate phosphoribosyltransferase n=1 Tax=Moorella sp. E308F TaxID=2572682 RepID=UPI0010FFBC8B|nr:anthranilate phosphoribosyltransferase [Moorella sp. E308F]MDK2816679.1 anthranilate phosphoribosyltransferase [Moorella sp. (in: firmicutes)]MDK2895392.1 anthranilate phosphoribosyltransferase [Moorella sp. (in: firmicutes)]GEA15782.1 anthranilate phosphoribosyltransferase [Moorella sp. E308F]